MLPYPSHAIDTTVAVFCFRANALVRRKQQCWTCSWCQHGSDRAIRNAAEAVNCGAQKRLVVRPIVERPRAA